VDHNVII